MRKSFNTESYIHTLWTNDRDTHRPLAPILTVKPGESFTVTTRNAFGKEFSDIQAFQTQMDNPNKWKDDYPLTGPIKIEGAGPQYGLAIHIEDIVPLQNYTCVIKGAGIMRGKLDVRDPHIYQTQEESDEYFIHLGHDVYMKGRPSLGVVATLDSTQRHAGKCSENGGNLDIYCLTAGSTIYLPVNYNEGLIAIGDAHFSQAPGESSGIGIEADAQVTLRVELTERPPFPIYETPIYAGVVGWGPTHESSLAKAWENYHHYMSFYTAMEQHTGLEIYQLSGGMAGITTGFITGNNHTYAMQVRKDQMSVGLPSENKNIPFFRFPKVISPSP